MVTAQIVRIGASRLIVNVQTTPEMGVGTFHGCADETGIPTLVEASEVLVTHGGARIALDLSRLEDAVPWCIQALAGTIAEAHRLSKEVVLIRCPDWLFQELRRYGTGGPVRHVGSLAAATDGVLGEPDKTLMVSLRSSAALIPRVRAAVGGFLGALGFTASQVEAVNIAVATACTHAVEHRSPRGLRNRVAVTVHAEPDALIVDVVDECDPPAGEGPESGWDECVQQTQAAVDRLEVLPDLWGTVWRMTRQLTGPPA